MRSRTPIRHSNRETGSITLIQVVFAMTLGLVLVMAALSLRKSAKLAYDFDRCAVEYQDLAGLADPNFPGRGACAAYASVSSSATAQSSSQASSSSSSPPSTSSAPASSSAPNSSSNSSQAASSSSVAPTATPLPTATNTPLPTNTAIPTNTPLPTNTPVPTITNTAVPTNTPLPTNTLVPTNTSLPPTATITNTPLPATPTRTTTPTYPTPTRTITPTPGGGPKGACFTGDTQILMDDGTLKRIDQVKVGDMVLAYPASPTFSLQKSSSIVSGKRDMLNGLAPKQVSKTFVHQDSEVLRLKTNGPNIDTTQVHPFYIIGRGWVKAGDLKIGDQLLTLNGKTFTILAKEILPNRETVYNIEVDDYHTFFVGDDPIWVHNKCCVCEPPDPGCAILN